MRWAVAVCMGIALAVAAWGRGPEIDTVVINGDEAPQTLSAFGFFTGSTNLPAKALIPYGLKTPLFSDYAEKQRFLYLPTGGQIAIDPEGRMAFPVGTALIKSFGYADADGGLKIIETRVLLHRKTGWVALPYVWRADGKDADIKLGGFRVPVSFRTLAGDKASISYAVPNKNQCKQCHASGDAVVPIGPYWQNMVFKNAATRIAMQRRSSFPRSVLPKEPVWNDPKTGTVTARALSYLRVNCGHCHAPTGSASNSGLFFNSTVNSDIERGIGKRPVAAGRGAGNFEFVVEPGHPEKSILIHRMKSTDPGIAMPELGRATVHAQGVALLETWIKAMEN
jgi:uncharacterized repeat protein (TIGR03806 family)